MICYNYCFSVTNNLYYFWDTNIFTRHLTHAIFSSSTPASNFLIIFATLAQLLYRYYGDLSFILTYFTTAPGIYWCRHFFDASSMSYQTAYYYFIAPDDWHTFPWFTFEYYMLYFSGRHILSMPFTYDACFIILSIFLDKYFDFDKQSIRSTVIIYFDKTFMRQKLLHHTIISLIRLPPSLHFIKFPAKLGASDLHVRFCHRIPHASYTFTLWYLMILLLIYYYLFAVII